MPAAVPVAETKHVKFAAEAILPEAEIIQVFQEQICVADVIKTIKPHRAYAIILISNIPAILFYTIMG